ncbi:MAG: N-6 DNA methylase [Ignavibacteriaceae bacterium]|nr:N-6 DNA methylase [Ignavibacteriaceae bacterium]
MPLSWNEIKSRAVKFSKDWESASEESAESQTFLNEFFEVFGINRRRVATFERPVKKIDGREGYIDLLWPGKILIEHKSKGKNLEKAKNQAIAYSFGLTEAELPKYILLCDFNKFRLFDLDENIQHEFLLKELVKHVSLFGFIAGYEKRIFKEEDPVNIEAAELMGKLHDKLKSINYKGHDLEVYLVRLVFCLFADDTNIFNKDIFEDYIKLQTKEDGSDLAAQIASLFFILNKPPEDRLKNLNESLSDFPYVNGKLFEEVLPQASFDKEMRNILLESSRLDWGKISPAVFGSLFQAVMNPEERRSLGAHYTSEKNILKVINSLFLDDLNKEFKDIKNNHKQLLNFHEKISHLKFLDPACGCGNFLVIAYRELRKLEIEILRILYDPDKPQFNIKDMVWVDIDQFYGIEIEEWPARISEVAMWLMDHQMNIKVSEEFGDYYVRLPLKKIANIVNKNALQIDWETIIAKDKLSYILGNPPFSGKQLQNEEQKKDIEKVLSGVKGSGILDYVTCWYIKAAKYIQDSRIKVAFVSTNSISQGEQVGALWNELFNNYKIKIHYAHRTFKWSNEARGNAAVHVIIIGFANYDISEKRLFEYLDIQGEPHEIKVKNVNPYLVEGKDFAVIIRKNPINNVPKMLKGSQPTDDGNFLMSEEEKIEFVKLEPQALKFIKPFVSAKEFLHYQKRWCFWLVDANPTEIKQCPHLIKRIENVREFRLKSQKAATVKWAQIPSRFTENRQPKSDYVLMPSHSSENRKYVPIGFFSKEFIVPNSCFSIPNATFYHFGILTSIMHNAWIKYTCGRIKSDYRYSNDIVYNNFPWPESTTDKQIKIVEEKAQNILDARKEFPNSSLADLYDPLTMPPSLVKAHQELDKAVDLCYRPQPFPNETKRIEFLFELYEKYTAGLFSKEKHKKSKQK